MAKGFASVRLEQNQREGSRKSAVGSTGACGRRTGARLSRLALVVPMLGLFALGLLPGCGRSGDPQVVSFKGGGFTLSQIESEYNRVNGPDAFASATSKEREDFARTLVDKELLLRLARSSSSKLNDRQARIYRITYEKDLQKAYLKNRRESFRVPADEEKKEAPLLARSAQILLAKLSSRDVRDQVVAAQKAGESFEEIAQKYAMPARNPKAPGAPPQYWREMNVRVDDPTPSPFLIRYTLLADLPEGQMSEPFEAPAGILFLKVVKIEPNAAAADTSYQRRVHQMITAVGYMKYYPQWNDSLKKAAAFDFTGKGYDVIASRFASYWDSISTAQKSTTGVDFQNLRAPLWRFTPEERAIPLYTMWGKTWTLGDYVESLNNIDLDFWPTVGPLGKITQQVQGRLYRLLYQQDAEKRGVPKLPDMAEDLRRLEEKLILTQYHDGMSSKLPPLTDASLEKYYENSPEKYRMAESVDLSILTFPKDKAARAQTVVSKLRSAGPLAWLDVAPAEHDADTTITYVSSTGPMNTGSAPPNPAWAPLVEAAKGMKEGEISSLIPTGDKLAVFRVIEHREERILPFAEAASLLRTNLTRSRQDSLLEVTLSAERNSAGIKVLTERLGKPTKEKPAAEGEAGKKEARG